jgi:hypothetical protein
VAFSDATLGVQDADTRLVEQVAGDAQNADAGVAPRHGASGIGELAGGLVVDGESADRPGTHLAREPRPQRRIGDAAREDEVQRRLELPRVLQEEGALLGEEDLEALVRGDLGLVGLHLSEVGVRRQVEREGVLQDDLGVQAAGGVREVSDPPGEGRVPLVDRLEAAVAAVGDELDVAPRGDAPQPRCARHLAELAADPLRVRRPEGLLAQPRVPTPAIEAPALLLGGDETEALERDLEHDEEAPVGPLAPGVPDRVE